jgi:predicted Zn-dependent protease
MVSRARTDGAGRYQFNGLRDGRYTVRVFAFRYDLQDQEQSVEIITQNIRGGEGTGFFPQDFYLLPKKGGLAEAEIGVVFAQEIPSNAQKVYDKAVKDLSNKRTNEGILGLNEAVQLFPDYYNALYRIGKELFIGRRYKEAIPFLIKAAQVNARSATTFYYLGYSLHNLGKEYDKAAITALNNAVLLAPSSTQVFFVLGKVERSFGKYPDAEKHLLQAKKLSKVAVPEIHKELAQLYADDLKKYKEAADELELYLKASKLEGSAAAETKKVVSGLREKAKAQAVKN